ncbi:MAG: hypothetical protein WKG07_39570 [Hymenobacter sp.]
MKILLLRRCPGAARAGSGPNQPGPSRALPPAAHHHHRRRGRLGLPQRGPRPASASTSRTAPRWRWWI